MDAQDHRRFERQFSRPIGGPVTGHAARPDLSLAAGRIVSSDTLFQGSREIGIEHYGSLYRLKITRQGKLILNK
jgi:hemin uptake protein HemP